MEWRNRLDHCPSRRAERRAAWAKIMSTNRHSIQTPPDRLLCIREEAPFTSDQFDYPLHR